MRCDKISSTDLRSKGLQRRLNDAATETQDEVKGRLFLFDDKIRRSERFPPCPG